VAIASPVHLVREGLAASLRGRPGLALVDTVDLDPRGLARIADIKQGIVLVDLGQTDPAAAARLIRAADPDTRLMAFALDETDELVFACAAAGFCGYVPLAQDAVLLGRIPFDPKRQPVATRRNVRARFYPPSSDSRRPPCLHRFEHEDLDERRPACR
jgi:hypothetical protein